MGVDKLDHHGEDDPQSFGPECILLLIVFQQLQKSFFRRVHRPVKWEGGFFYHMFIWHDYKFRLKLWQVYTNV